MKAAGEITCAAAAALFGTRRIAAPIALAAFALLAAAALACGADDVGVGEGDGYATSPGVPAVEDILPPMTVNSMVADARKILAAEHLPKYASDNFSQTFGCPLWLNAAYYEGRKQWAAYCETSEGGELDKIRFIWDNHPYALGTSFDDVDIVHNIRMDSWHYYAASGDFDFKSIKKRLREGGFASEVYAGVEIWTGAMPIIAIERTMQAALYEDAKMFIVAGIGSNQDNIIRELIDAVALWDDLAALAAQSSDLWRVREEAGAGLMVGSREYIYGHCGLFPRETRSHGLNCRAQAYSITAEGKIKRAILFSSAEDAKLGAEIIAARKSEGFADVKAEGDMLTYTWADPDPQASE